MHEPGSEAGAYADREVLRIRLIAEDSALFFLNDNVEYWQLVMALYSAGSEGVEGTNALLRKIRNKKVSDVTLYNFIKTAVAKGYFVKSGGKKKNNNNLKLSDEMRSKISAILAAVYGGG